MRTIPEMAATTRVLAGRIGRMQVGEMVTYKELDELIGGDVRSADNAGRLRSARHVALREHGVATESVRGEGIKRLGGHDLPGVGDAALGRVRRASRRAVRTMLTAAGKLELDPKASTAINARASLLTMIQTTTSNKAITRAETAAAETMSELTFERTVALFTGKAPAPEDE